VRDCSTQSVRNRHLYLSVCMTIYIESVTDKTSSALVVAIFLLPVAFVVQSRYITIYKETFLKLINHLFLVEPFQTLPLLPSVQLPRQMRASHPNLQTHTHNEVRSPIF
jgi:hypothetical protein